MLKTCANKLCQKEFTPNTHNQKYCNPDCCRTATNAKLMVQYYAKKEIRSGVKRVCVRCRTGLSRYNNTSTCGPCSETEASRNAEVVKMFRNIKIRDLNVNK